ncbi:hypothetical protein I656_03113 [Geobacillus sp. WSUCF1]|nr:hypothetical protein I656_03113 [Geobacillus sp. WSUCF1]
MKRMESDDQRNPRKPVKNDDVRQIGGFVEKGEPISQGFPT